MDTIRRQEAIEHCKKRLYETALNQGLLCESDMCQDIAENRIAIWLNEVPSAQPERIIYANMSDEEFERWLYEHGICNPNIHESIPCDAVPLLIDNAISELPSAEPEITLESAIDYLHSIGWMQNHDREMYESGLREQLADDSGSYDALIPCEDTISRRAAIDYCYLLINVEHEQGSDEMNYGQERVNQTETILHHLEFMPSAEPEIIYCKDCVHHIDGFFCRQANHHTSDKDHCASVFRAERRTG